MRARTNIVAFIVLLLASMSAGAVTLPELATQAAVIQIEGALNIFQLEHGRYPSQREGLSALVTGQTDTPQTNFIAYIKTLPKDWWDRDYVYRFPGVHNPESFDLYSLGQDGRSKTGGNDPDDINDWNQQRPWIDYYARSRQLDRLMNFLITGICVSALMFVLWQNRRRKRRATTPTSETSRLGAA